MFSIEHRLIALWRNISFLFAAVLLSACSNGVRTL